MVIIIETGFSKRDHFCKNIWDLIWEKNTFKTYQNTVLHTYRSGIHIQKLYVYKTVFLICFNGWFFHKSGHKCFNTSGPFLQIKSQLL